MVSSTPNLQHLSPIIGVLHPGIGQWSHQSLWEEVHLILPTAKKKSHQLPTSLIYQVMFSPKNKKNTLITTYTYTIFRPSFLVWGWNQPHSTTLVLHIRWRDVTKMVGKVVWTKVKHIDILWHTSWWTTSIKSWDNMKPCWSETEALFTTSGVWLQPQTVTQNLLWALV